MKIKMTPKKIFFIVVSILFIILLFGTYHYRPDLKLIDSIIAGRQSEILKEKDNKITELNGKIELINNQLVISQKKYSEVKNKLSALEHQSQNIQLPGSANETRERFRRLGYVPK